MSYKKIVLAISSAVLLSGCASIQEASTSMGSTGTGVLAGGAAGIGAGVLCDKLTKGKYTAGCVAIGLGVGAAVGTWAASLDEAAEEAVPAMDCSSVKRRMNFPIDATKPIARLSIADGQAPSFVVKPGESLKIPIKMDLATPGESGSEQEIAFKIIITDGNTTHTGGVITKECGGDYSLPLSQPTDKEGVFKTNITLFDASNNSAIEGGSISICYTVASDGINKCDTTMDKVIPSTTTKPSKKTNKQKKTS